ncbi:BrnA antitoxin family protein [Bosea sp. 685]|uniref:BrnA antitoxin family protein n=1 Tax=Bosea sp. 685 TaxID=3080057 RepID=UPI0028934309|nr:BrnA antitoxin family protein [Bosea sp. 685]WNJ89855.1 BrnA antitoxin family protein [Bosea sp. 685]
MKPPYDKPLSPEALAALKDDEIDFSDIPELDETFWRNAKLVEPDRTQLVTLRVKKSVLEAYKAQGRGYQTRMNTVLETYARSQLKRTS